LAKLILLFRAAIPFRACIPGQWFQGCHPLQGLHPSVWVSGLPSLAGIASQGICFAKGISLRKSPTYNGVENAVKLDSQLKAEIILK